jgi:hypothetical protein
MPASYTHTGIGFADMGQGNLIRGVDNPHYADTGTDPAPRAEILVNKY